MTTREGTSFKLNWTLDKVLMGVLIFLAIKTYGSIEDTIKEVNNMKARWGVVEWRLEKIEHKLDE